MRRRWLECVLLLGFLAPLSVLKTALGSVTRQVRRWSLLAGRLPPPQHQPLASSTDRFSVRRMLRRTTKDPRQ